MSVSENYWDWMFRTLLAQVTAARYRLLKIFMKLLPIQLLTPGVSNWF